MRTLVWAVTVIVSVSGASCAVGAADDSPESIIALERGALDRWGKGDPKGYYELMAAGETYFDPTTEKRVDGIEPLMAHIAPFDGKIAIEHYEMIDPKVQRDGSPALTRAHSTGTARRCMSDWTGSGESSTRTGRT